MGCNAPFWKKSNFLLYVSLHDSHPYFTVSLVIYTYTVGDQRWHGRWPVRKLYRPHMCGGLYHIRSSNICTHQRSLYLIDMIVYADPFIGTQRLGFPNLGLIFHVTSLWYSWLHFYGNLAPQKLNHHLKLSRLMRPHSPTQSQELTSYRRMATVLSECLSRTDGQHRACVRACVCYSSMPILCDSE